MKIKGKLKQLSSILFKVPVTISVDQAGKVNVDRE
jgi:hypothetical protein